MRTFSALVAILGLVTVASCDLHTGHGERNPVEYDVRSAESGVESDAIRAEDMRKILALDARPMMDALNVTGVKRVDESAVRVLVAAWLGLRTDEPKLNWTEMVRTDVRFALAEQLVRAYMNGARTVPNASIAAFGRSYLNSQSDQITLNRAIYLVVLAGTTADIEHVKNLLLQAPVQATFQAGVSALASVCSPEASSALQQIRSSSSKAIYRDIVDDVLTKSAAFRARSCKG